MLIGPPEMGSTVARFSFPISVVDYAADTVTGENMIAAGAEILTQTFGHKFPLAGEEIDRLELQSPGAVFALHTPAPDLVVAVKGSKQRGSVLRFDGRDYEVKALKPWEGGPAGAAVWHEAIVQEVVR